MTLGMSPQTGESDQVRLLTTFVHHLHDVCVTDGTYPATAARGYRNPVPVQQLIDPDAHLFLTTDVAAWLNALETAIAYTATRDLHSIVSI
ncbi:hypothetical protein A9W96_01840 [Mycobacterium sp. 1245852.3]|nr:hypothetical protein A9W96_01840 [Mycobacterium sp. 1245852.3]